MQKKLLAIFLISIFFAIGANAQEAVRQLPFFMKAEFNKYYPNPKYFPSTNKYVPTPAPPEAYKHKAPDKLMNPNAGFELINVSKLNGHQSETWMAINPTNPNNLIATSNDFENNSFDKGYRMSSFVSHDGGKTWNHSLAPSNVDAGFITVSQQMGATNFDPAITFDANGKVYYAYGFCQVPGDNLEGDNGIFYTASTDGGNSWQEIDFIALEIDGSSSQPFHDRYTITADNNQNSPFKNNVYIAWQRFKVDPAVVIARYKPSNGYWETPIKLGTGQTQAPMPAIGPNGEIYVVWHSLNAQDNIDALFVKSVDGGNVFTKAKAIQTVKSIGTRNQSSGRQVLADKQNIRVSSVCQIAVDRSNGPRRGWIYVVQAGKEKDGSGKNGIFLTYSTDGGTNWAASLRVDDNTLRNDMFFPSISVDPITGIVAVFYYSSQNDPTNEGVDGYLAYSTDGTNFNRIRLTPESIYLDKPTTVSSQGTGNYYWGDYTSVVAYNGMMYPLFWWPTQSGSPQWSLELFTVRVGNAPKPPTNFAAQNLPVFPAEVKLSWTDPTQDLLGNNLTNFKIYINRNGEKITEVNSGVGEYTDKNVTDGIAYTYKIFAVNEFGTESLPVETTIIAGGALEPNPPTLAKPEPRENGILLSWLNPTKRVDGTDLTDFEKVNIYVDGTLKQTIGKTQAQIGQYSQVLLELTPDKFYKISIKAVGKRGEVETESAALETVGFAGAPKTAMNENFDGQTVTAFYTNKNWGKTTEKALSAPNSFTDNPNNVYENRTDNFVIFAPLLIGETNKTISFEHIALLEKKDFALVSVSSDYGLTWKILKSYNINSSSKFVKDNLEASDWESAHVGLGDYVGDTVFVRFSVLSDVFLNDYGWLVDNVRLDDNPNSVNGNEFFELFTLNCYPNPVSNSANIVLELLEDANVEIVLYDVLGNKIGNIASGYQKYGSHNFNLNASSYSAGVYYLRATANGFTKTIALVFEK